MAFVSRPVTRYGIYGIYTSILTAVVLVSLVVGDARAQDDAQDPYLFYPALPDPPRVQFLTKLSSPLDLGGKSGGFRDFLFGGEDAEADLVGKPYGLAVFDKAIYVVDTRSFGYGVFDLESGRAHTVRPSAPGTLQKPINIAIDEDGTRYVTDTGRNQVLVYDSKDRFLRAMGKSGDFTPVDVLIVGDRLYITDIMHHQVHALDKRTGEVLLTFAKSGSDEGELFHPTNLAMGPDGSIFVADTTNFRIQRYSADGELMGHIGEIGLSAGQFARPKGIAVSRDEHVYVVDAAFQNVQILDMDGTPLMFFAEGGMTPGSLHLPTVVKLDYDHVDYFRKYAHPEFDIEYLIFVVSQFGPNKVSVYGFGLMRD